MKIAYVVVRYGLEILGGAEQGCRMLAEHLARSPGNSVEVFTTCALDASTWSDHYRPGIEVMNGVTVHRFASQSGRHSGFDAFSNRILPDPERSQPTDQDRWIEMQGPVCPDAVAAAEASDAEVVAFYPYLYWPTVHGIGRMGGRAIMHPAAHDEAPLRLPIFEPVFAAARGLVLQTDAERRLVDARFPSTTTTPQLLMGLGVERHDGDPAAARAALGLDDSPYLLWLNRVDNGKGAALLAAYFAAYKRRRAGPLKLVFAGPVVHRPPSHPDVIVAGGVDEATKWGLLHGAVAFINPSAYEAFSIVLMEAWTAGLPTVVNARCEATVEHVRRSGGGLAFAGFATFEAVIDRLVGDARLRAAMGGAGRRYVEDNFTWPRLTSRYEAFLSRIASSAARVRR